MTALRRVNWSIPVLGILLALTAILRFINLANTPARLDDEGTYVAQAYAMTQWGELAHYTYWYDHPPVGWLQLAVWSLLSGHDLGGNSVAAARYLMVIVAVITAALLWTLARRLELSSWGAAAAVAVYALSPLAISLGRTVYLDNIAIAWIFGALVLLCSPQRRLAAMFGAAACFGIAVLTKETMLLFVPMFAWLVWTRTAPETRRYALAVFGAVFGVVLSTYVLMAAVRGELVPGPGHVSLWDGVRFQLWARDAGGSLADPYSLKRHTLSGWLQLDPALPFLAAPVAVAGLFIQRFRPFAVGLAVVVATVARPGYLPVPLALSALPLIALVGAGVAETALRYVFDSVPRQQARRTLLRVPVLTAAVLIASITLTLWLPSYRGLLTVDDDAPMAQAEQWISENVPKSDRLIVDDAFWVDLVNDGRDRRDVVWAYKVDTDEQVRAWAANGWTDYDWVVSTSSMRANVPSSGVLADAITHSRPVATFGSGGLRVDVLHIDTGGPDSKNIPPAAGTYGDQLAARLADSADPGVLSVLQSPTLDQRVPATLAVIAATEPVLLDDIPAIEGEDRAGTPRREIRLAAAGARLARLVHFFHSQVGAFSAESVSVTPTGLDVRFPLRNREIGLAASSVPLPADGPALVRVADLRHGDPSGQLNLVRLDGSNAGSIPMSTLAETSDYYAVPAGTYVATTQTDGDAPVIRQVLTVNSGAAYTLSLFSGSDADDIVMQLVPDGVKGDTGDSSSVRLIEASNVTGPVGLSVTSVDTGQRTVLADGVRYGLVTGYASLPGGEYIVALSAGGRDWERPTELPSGEPMSLLLTDGEGGPSIVALSDTPADAVAMHPPTLAVPADPATVEQIVAAHPAGGHSAAWLVPVVLVAGIGIGVLGMVARRRMGRHW